MAEKVLKMIPEGTHDYEKFINVDDLIWMMDRNGFMFLRKKFYLYDPIGNQMVEENLLKTNFISAFIKE